MSLHLTVLLASVVLDIMANLSLERSNGFKCKRWGIAALLFITAAFAFLAYAVQGLSLFIAYSLWGVLSIAGTALATWLLLGHAMNKTIVAGLALLVLAIILMQGSILRTGGLLAD